MSEKEEIQRLQEANARGEIPMLTIDRAGNLSSGDLITRVTENEVVIRSPHTLWIATRKSPQLQSPQQKVNVP